MALSFAIDRPTDERVDVAFELTDAEIARFALGGVWLMLLGAYSMAIYNAVDHVWGRAQSRSSGGAQLVAFAAVTGLAIAVCFSTAKRLRGTALRYSFSRDAIAGTDRSGSFRTPWSQLKTLRRSGGLSTFVFEARGCVVADRAMTAAQLAIFNALLAANAPERATRGATTTRVVLVGSILLALFGGIYAVVRDRPVHPRATPVSIEGR